MKNFLKSDRHLHKDEAVRLTAVSEFDTDNAEHQKLLETMVDSDASLVVRRAAMLKITSLSTLNQAMQMSDEESLSVAATERFTDCVANAEDGTDLDAFLINACDAACEVIAASARTPEQRSRALAKVQDEPALVRIVQASKFHDARLAAAERLVSHDSLRAALAASRSRDKEVAKHIQQRLDTFAAQEAAQIAARHALKEVVTAMQSLQASVWSPQTQGRFDALNMRWSGLDAELKASQATEFEAARAKVAALLAEHDAQVVEQSDAEKLAAKPKESEQSSAAPGEDAAATQPDDDIVTAIKDGLSGAKLEELVARLAVLKENSLVAKLETSESGKQLFAHAEAVSVLFDPPYEINAAKTAAVTTRLRRVDTLLNVDKHLPGLNTERLDYLTLLTSHQAELKVRMSKAKQESDDRVKATHRQFSALAGIVKEGKWGPASSMFRRLQKKIAGMEANEKAGFSDKLARAEQELNTMADWQDFAARPKLEALCEQMEALPAKELAPEAIAKAVRKLQSDWKGLGVSRASNDLWARFKTAGDTAYEPCKAFFAEKQQERQSKLDNKIKVCEELEKSVAEVDWDAVDWKALQRTINHAKRDWSRNRVTDRKPDRQLEERFTAILKPIDTKLAEQYDANAALKQELIDKVAKLAAGDINMHAANQARSLQASWKSVGITRRSEDQSLWEAFNGHCRTIFKTIKDAEREKYKASMSHVIRAKEIIKTLKQAARKGGADETLVQELTTEFNNLAEFPERDQKFLRRDFRQALDDNAKLQATKSKQKKQQAFDEIKRCVGLCEQLEDAVEMPELMTGTFVEEMKDAWEATDIALPREWSGLLLARRDAAFDHLQAGTQFNLAANEAARRDVLIKMEVAAGVDTPAEDKALRMQFQLANLQQGMTGSAVSDAKTELKSLEREWLTMPPAPKAKRDALHSRYLKAMKGA